MKLFGKRAPTKIDLVDIIEKQRSEIKALETARSKLSKAYLNESRLCKETVATSGFWQLAATDYAEQIVFWQTRHLDLLRHIGKQDLTDELRKYVVEVCGYVKSARDVLAGPSARVDTSLEASLDAADFVGEAFLRFGEEAEGR